MSCVNKVGGQPTYRTIFGREEKQIRERCPGGGVSVYRSSKEQKKKGKQLKALSEGVWTHGWPSQRPNASHRCSDWQVLSQESHMRQIKREQLTTQRRHVETTQRDKSPVMRCRNPAVSGTTQKTNAWDARWVFFLQTRTRENKKKIKTRRTSNFADRNDFPGGGKNNPPARRFHVRCSELWCSTSERFLRALVARETSLFRES